MNTSRTPGRKSLPHLSPLEFHNQTTIIYVTQVVAGRRPLLNRSPAVKAILSAWEAADHWLIGRYVIMPDHLHCFCAPSRFPTTALKDWIAFWRSEATRHWPWPEEKPVWQKDFFDRQLRHQESYTAKWRYMLENPVRRGLTTRPEEWPWQGELHSLMWHEPG